MKKQKRINHARSKKNGIIFYSNLDPFFAVETILDNSDEIHSRIIPAGIRDLFGYFIADEEIAEINKKKVIMFDILLILIGIISRNFWVIFGALYFSTTISFDFFDFMFLSYQLKSKNGANKSTARFHAAEHMVIAAYERLQRIPTLEEVKKESRFSKSCGSIKTISKIFRFTFISLSLVFIASWNTIAYLISVIIIISFDMISLKKGWYKFLQIFVTSKPTNIELNLAIEAIKNFESMEEEIKSQYKDSKCITLISGPFSF